MAQRQVDVVVEFLGSGRRDDVSPVVGKVGCGELAAVVGVRRECVVRLPVGQRRRDVEHGCEVDRVDRLAADRPLVGDERGAWAALQQFFEVAPGVMLCGDLCQRPDREATGQAVALVQHDRHVLGIGEERQSILGQRGGRPELAARLDGGS